MGRGAVRWIAIALVGALMAAVGVGLVGGDGDQGEPTGAVDGPGPVTGAADQAVDGPHLWFDLCAGVACPSLDEEGQRALVADLDADPRVASTLFVSSEQAYQLFLDRFGDQEELVEAVDPAEMPARIEVELLDPARVDEVLADFAQREGVARGNDARTVSP